MNRSGFTTRSSAAGVLAVVAASGLVLAGCGNSPGSSTASASGSGSAAGASASSAASSGSGGNTSAISAGFFPLAVGNKWVYAVKGGGTVTNQVIALAPAAGGTKATLKVREFLDGSPTTTTSALIVHSDGSISVPLTQVGNSSFKLKSGSVIWPSAAQLASGQAHHDTLVIGMDAAGHTTSVRAHVVVKGEGTQTVSVPAGTYQATVIDEAMTEKISGFAVTLDIRTWVTNGVGPVKDEVTSGAGGRSAVSIVEELKSFTKG